MVETANDLVLLERVFLRLGSADTDDQLEVLLAKFLTPVVQKLSSPDEIVRKKVMELLIHVNKRVKTRSQIQLPVEALLEQYQDPKSTSFVTNFTIIYLKLGFPRLPIEKQTELVPLILNALEQKPVSHLDSILLLVIPLLGKVRVPTDPAKVGSLYGLNEKPTIGKHLLDMLLDMLLLPYGALSAQSEANQANSIPVPPCMSPYSFKRITSNNAMKPEELEEMKLGIVRFLGHGVFKDEQVLIHLIVAASDTRFSVANLADMELKKVVGGIDWGNLQQVMPIFSLFLGTQSKATKEEHFKSPASTRIRLKLLTYLGRVTEKGFAFPASIQIIFDSLYGTNTNTRLKTLALVFTMNLVRSAEEAALINVAPIILSGMQKLIQEGEETHQGQAYLLIGLLAHRFPKTVYHNISLLESFFKNLETASPDLKLQIREGVLNLILAYKHDIFPNEADKDGRLNILFALIKFRMSSNESMVRFIAVRTLATIFPPTHVPSKYLLLLSTGDLKDDVSAEAFKSLYGTARKADIDLNRKHTVDMPDFREIVSFVYSEAQILLKDQTKCYSVGNNVLAFEPKTFIEVVLFLRLCLLKSINVPLTREVIQHPCQHSPIISKYFRTIFEENVPIESNSLLQYTSLLKQLLIANPSIEIINCMVEAVGCLPNLISIIKSEETWIRDQLNSTKEEIREYTSTLYALLLDTCSSQEQTIAITYLIKQTNSKNLESQHGALLALGTCLELPLIQGKTVKIELIKETIEVLYSFLQNSNGLLVGAACTGFGLLGRTGALPLDLRQVKETIGSPESKRSNDGITKIDIVNRLMDVMNNGKLAAKLREKAAKSLGLLCVGEQFPQTDEVLKGLLGTAKETKDVEVHFTIGESLVMCCQSVWSPEARNLWTTIAENHRPATNGVRSNANLEYLLDELLSLAAKSHPNSKQASAIWLLAALKGCSGREPVEKRLQAIQNTFMDLLCENSDIVQDVASKGVCLVYDTHKSEDLLAALVKQLTSGTRQVTQVTSDTKLFEEGQLGASPTGGNLTTYKELCSLASDLNKPDLIYQFMHLANHNAIWNSKKGAAFGFSSIAERCGEDLKVHMPIIIPKLYRYQFDPTPAIQASMQNIWRVLVAEPQKVLSEYYDAILSDLLENLTSPQYRVRQSCCLALQDFLKGTASRSIHDALPALDALWSQLFRVMDDHHEATRLAAHKTARILSKLCVRACDASQGAAGARMVAAVLPPLLGAGIGSAVAEVRLVSLQTIGELVGAAGAQLRPFLARLIPALLQATGELESSKLSYLSTMMGAQSQAQEAIDSARASFAKSHFTTETVTKSLQYADASILAELVPRVVELLKGPVGLGTRVAAAHFVTLLVVQLGRDVQPYAGRLLAVLVGGLTDRNAAIRRHFASTIGHLVATAKETSLEKLFAKLQVWYFEREDDQIRSACAFAIQSIGIHNQEVLKQHSDVVLPLVFFAMHCERSEETRGTLEIWTEIWAEQSPGTETGIRQNLERICEILKMGLESPSWTMKAQAANAVATVASKLGTSMDSKHRNTLINILLNGLAGRTWNGKDKLLKALSSICSNCNEAIKTDNEVNLSQIIDAVLKESRKEEVTYKIAALECLGEILSSLEIDKFDEIYAIIEPILCDSRLEKDGQEETSGEEVAKHREQSIKLKETAYETLGKTWPNNKRTQEKYRALFVKHCVAFLPKITRSVQVSVVTALYNFVDKLILLNEKCAVDEEPTLDEIVDDILVAVKYALAIAKHTRLRKEALNVIYCMAKKLKENKERQLEKVQKMFELALVEISGDNQPEIKSRLTDIKKLLTN